MRFSLFFPHSLLTDLVDCYWIIEGNENSEQKIIPDGRSELIFHFGDRYKIKKNDNDFENQSFALAAGQISKPIFLSPTGESGVLGIKFSPLGMWHLFGWDMSLVTNDVINLIDLAGKAVGDISEKIQTAADHQSRLVIVEEFLLQRCNGMKKPDGLFAIVKDIDRSAGQISIKELSFNHKISIRKLQRLFSQRVGISAKSYSRIIRFKKVHSLLEQPSLNMLDAVYLLGYFDQSHLIKDFRALSGENPEKYFSGDHSFSNFFLNKM